MHFLSDFQQFVFHPGSIQYVYIFSIAGIFILLIVVLNFISLVSVLSTNRLKESGIRKISGASKGKIVSSFLTGPFILVSLSLIFTFLLIEIFQSSFNKLSDSTFVSFHQNTFVLLALIVIGLVIASVSGIVPGIFIANFEPSDALKQKKKLAGISYRKYLIAFQFTLAIVLMSSTFLIYKQLNYIFHKDLGFNKEDIVHVPLKRKMGENYALMKQKLLTNPNVEQITNGSPILSSGVEFPGWTWDVINKDDKHSIASIQADCDFIIWVIIAFVIATPIAYYAMNKWLESFAYKTSLSWWIFALAGVLTLGIALLTVSWQSWRAATRNPVEALRYE